MRDRSCQVSLIAIHLQPYQRLIRTAIQDYIIVIAPGYRIAKGFL